MSEAMPARRSASARSDRAESTGGRSVALGSAVFGIVLTFAQDVAPAWTGFHAWQYATALVLAGIAVAGYAWSARSGADGELGVRLVIPALGALVIMAAGVASGLLGPDSETVARAPGTVAPLPDVGAAAFFPIAGPDAIARGDARIAIRRKDGASFDIGPGERRFVGPTALELEPATAAYVEARDSKGGRLTITQPTNPAFLSPVLLFTQQVTIASRSLPADAFATPALHRQIKAFYFSKDAAASAQHGTSGKAAVLFAVDDEAGRLVPGGIGFVSNGEERTIGGVSLRVAVGTFPALVISAVPDPIALWIGAGLFAAGIVYAFAAGRTSGRPSTPLS